MLTGKTITFLKDLKENNNREWFQENKNRYLEVKEEFESFVNLLIQGVVAIDEEVSVMPVKDCVFRIYRDTRFSPDKTPYKTNFGAYIVRGGKKSPYAGYYFHLEPGTCFVAGGLYVPPSDILKSVRLEIYNHPEEFISITSHPDFKKAFGEITGDKLKKMPRDFPESFKYPDLLKFKSYNVVKEFDEEFIMKDDLVESVIRYFGLIKPLNHFFNRAIEDVVEGNSL